MHATFVTLRLQVVQPLANVHETKWTPHVKRQSDIAQSCNSSAPTPTSRSTFGSHLRAAPNRGGGIEQCSTYQPHDEMPSIDTSAVTNVAVTPAAEPCNIIAGHKYIGGSDSEL